MSVEILSRLNGWAVNLVLILLLGCQCVLYWRFREQSNQITVYILFGVSVVVVMAYVMGSVIAGAEFHRFFFRVFY